MNEEHDANETEIRTISLLLCVVMFFIGPVFSYLFPSWSFNWVLYNLCTILFVLLLAIGLSHRVYQRVVVPINLYGRTK